MHPFFQVMQQEPIHKEHRLSSNTLTIWLVEDDVAQLQLFKTLLEKDFPEVSLYASTSAEELLKQLKARFTVPKNLGGDRNVHIVITDLHLTKMTGMDLLSTIKNDPALCWLPVLFLSGTQSEMDIMEAYRAGATAYVVKPSDLAKFQILLKNTILFWRLVHH